MRKSPKRHSSIKDAILQQGIDALEVAEQDGASPLYQVLDFLHEEHPRCLSDREWDEIESKLQSYNEDLSKI